MFDSPMFRLMVQDFLDISDPFWLQTVYLSLVDLGHWRFSRLEPRSRDLMRAQMRGGGVSFSVLAEVFEVIGHRGYSSHHPVEDHDLET